MMPGGGTYLTTLRVDGVIPITRNPLNKSRPSYQDWLTALKKAAGTAREELRAQSDGPYSLRVEMRLYAPYDQGSDLDNYIKDIQDALAEMEVFGTATVGSPMKGDERVDHLVVWRKRVTSPDQAGVEAEVWALG
jgi:Holliday junction resolvase RusA-like endonuclease